MNPFLSKIIKERMPSYINAPKDTNFFSELLRQVNYITYVNLALLNGERETLIGMLNIIADSNLKNDEDIYGKLFVNEKEKYHVINRYHEQNRIIFKLLRNNLSYVLENSRTTDPDFYVVDSTEPLF